jgi:dihydrofolate synthase/folylpolyglutamate synthase
MRPEPEHAIASRADAEAFLDERIGHGVQPGLERIEGLLAFMGDPHTSYPTIHVAGTNGKTTVTRMVQQILGAQGLATGTFTSPHLHRVEERFTVHGAPIEAERFIEAVRDIAWFVVGYEQAASTPVTYFEVTAALAFSLFANEAIDVGIVEVGLGGRLDATNVVDADVSVVTGIDIDHTEFLGSSIEQIAAEKVAILKDDGTLVTGPLPEAANGAVEQRVDATRARWVRFPRDFQVVDATVGVGGWQCAIEGVHGTYDELFLPLHGRHQVDHLATAIAASEMFLGQALDEDALMLAVGSMTSPGRLEVVARRPIVLLDGAHNAQGFAGLASTLDLEFPPIQWKLVVGMRGQRSPRELLTVLKGRVDGVYAAAIDDPQSHDPDQLAASASDVLGVPGAAFTDPLVALAAARDDAGPEGGVIVAGSLYLVGAVHDAFGPRRDRSVDAHVRYEAEVDLGLDIDDGEVDDDSDEEGSSFR